MSGLHFPVPGLAEQLSAEAHPIRNIASLRRAVQGAISLEFAIIAPCMTALWSIQQPEHEVADFIHGRVFWTLARTYQLANLMLSIGGVPKFTGELTPLYPCKMLGESVGEAPVEVRLGPADARFFSQVMPLLAISSTADAPQPGKAVETLGQFYRVIEDGMVFLEEQAQMGGETIFDTTAGYKQKRRMGYGVEAMELLTISNLMQAHEVLRRLLGEIEGGVQPLPEALLVLGEAGAVRPEVRGVTDEVAEQWAEDTQALSALFDSCFSQLLRVLERSFERDEQHYQRYLTLAPLLMRDLLPGLATLLMQLPVREEAAENGLPQWRYSAVSAAHSADRLTRLLPDSGRERKVLLEQALQLFNSQHQPLAETS